MSCCTHCAETSWRVKLLGPIHDWSFGLAFAEMVMIALRKSPAEVCTEAGRSGEEEGFEDVGASGVLVDEKAADNAANAVSEPKETVEEVTATEEPKREKESSEEKTTDEPQISSESTDPSSPSIGLPDQVDNIKLDNEPQGEQGTSASDNKQPEPEASRPEDVPPPLFSSNEQPVKSTEAPTTETTKGPNTVKDGSEEDSAEQYIQLDTDGQPVVGDYLKIMFVENKVVPTILVSISYPMETMSQY